MRNIMLIVLLLGAFRLYGQNMDSIGVDNAPYVNTFEAELLNELLKKERDMFDFTDKKVAFVTGSSGNVIKAKSDYFESSVKPWIKKNSRPQIFMVQLTENERKVSGGYDVLVLSWVKLFTDRRKRKIIEQLGSKK